ncbi:hypothetical protein EF405_13930 [Cyclobacteriaceae bacterium YHN15]|nr:hypothetical protein EF405_13930 [Cyclobacteriaceae bacterium YHN15]
MIEKCAKSNDQGTKSKDQNPFRWSGGYKGQIPTMTTLIPCHVLIFLDTFLAFIPIVQPF